MNKTIKTFGTVVACLALTGTCLAAPHRGRPANNGPAPIHHRAAHQRHGQPAPHNMAHHGGHGHHHLPPAPEPPPPPPPPPPPAPVVHHVHHTSDATGVVAIGAALIGGVIGSLIAN